MIYKEKMLCKHYKGSNLLEKSIYQILKVHVSGKELGKDIYYLGNDILEEKKDLVVYQNIFQENAFYAQEYVDMISLLSPEIQEECEQVIKIQPLTIEELEMLQDPSFQKQKWEVENLKGNTKLTQKRLERR